MEKEPEINPDFVKEKKEILLVDKYYPLRKIEGKGGWTFIEIPGIPMPKTPFGMLRVKGSIDRLEFEGLNLMPLGNGNLFMPVKAETRKKIKKQAPDTVRLTIYEDRTPRLIPEDLLLCMEDEQGLRKNSHPTPRVGKRLSSIG